MLHTKFQAHQFISSVEEDILRFLLYMGMFAILTMWPTPMYKFSFSFSHELSDEIWFQMTKLFLRKTSFNFEILVTFGKGQRMALTF